MAGSVKRFRRVLHVREVERQITQGELAERMREESNIITRLDAARAERDRALDDFCSGRDGVISPQQLWFERQSIDVIEQTVDTGKQELESCRQRIEETKGVLVEKHRNVQLMEKHVGKLVDLDNKRILAVEQKGLDDITSMRFLRSRREGSPL
jgi:flagellar export protein FliJ